MSAARTPAGDGAPRAAAAPCGCEEALARLFEYLDAELPEPDCLRLAAHLAVCEHCLDAAGAEEHVRTLIRRSCVERAPEALRVRVVAQLTVLRFGGRASMY
jgi:anti-sigma factor (TIGR02949 family)